jgi:serine protease
LDAFTIALGHEIEETVTDPGAEDIINGKNLGGWYDPFDANENGDKCAYVGSSPFNGIVGPGEIPNVPGESANITGTQGGTFPVQSLWSNASAGGAGYCAGAGTDLPAPLQ